MHGVPPNKLIYILGADAALYMTVQRYGVTDTIFDSAVVVSVSSKMVALRIGALLWGCGDSASSSESNNSNQGGQSGHAAHACRGSTQRFVVRTSLQLVRQKAAA